MIVASLDETICLIGEPRRGKKSLRKELICHLTNTHSCPPLSKYEPEILNVTQISSTIQLHLLKVLYISNGKEMNSYPQWKMLDIKLEENASEYESLSVCLHQGNDTWKM